MAHSISMTAEDVGEILAVLSLARVRVWIDGGWGIDALLGRQTRAHTDLDLVVPDRDVGHARATLEARGFTMALDERPTRLVMRDSMDRQVDLHPVVLTGEAEGYQQLPDGTLFHYPPDSFRGRGVVGAVEVPCLTAESQMACHTGYPPTAKDRIDIDHLARQFGIPVPPGYDM